MILFIIIGGLYFGFNILMLKRILASEEFEDWIEKLIGVPLIFLFGFLLAIFGLIEEKLND